MFARGDTEIVITTETLTVEATDAMMTHTVPAAAIVHGTGSIRMNDKE